MATSLAKGLMGLGGMGSLAGGAYLAKPYMFPKGESIEAKLNLDKWEILSTEGNDSAWNDIYGKYKTKELSDPSRFDSKIAKDEDQSTGLPKLKESCKLALTQEFKESLYRTVTKWCVVPVSASDRLEKLGGYTKISVDKTSSNPDGDLWTRRETEFKTKLNENNAYLGVSLPSTTGSQSPSNIDLLKDGCKTHMDKKNYDGDFEGSMEKVKKWCGK
ncbi:hypothetical protein HF1_13280 [Mycoplasma haemofelis str. Langford 1]|uniref:Uncharacterized protein n=2 Tax=Mycoplasma haemofelis TaxID=29501 RepID=F6FGK2_MYCHI|nr:hypothetical protein [Mycoplasma haemofelis]AEG73640.1 hypothetical protein MHF_1406 [Mycoplasma haemofelis Ohio2]CBY93336.1 hypothetical protein HF1_13280 [Mycoplasma haemofelis str. Langford 1]